MGLYSDLTKNDLYEVLPTPDWERNARPCWRNKHDLASGLNGAHCDYTEKCKWPSMPDATTETPCPSSTRFFIVSTNKTWQSRVWDVLTITPKLTDTLERELGLCVRRMDTGSARWRTRPSMQA
jgi:hypothetical protein